MDREKTIDRIKKLMALAKDNPNKNEGLSASRKVEELLISHGMTMDDIVIPKKKVVYKQTVEKTKVYEYPEPRTPFFETVFGMLLLLLIKGLIGTPVGWFVVYMLFVSFIK